MAPGGDERVVAIHQPNFIPWLGYFDKLARADVFILLDSVQFPKKAGTWMNRVKVLVGGEPRWITVPIDRSYSGVRTVKDMRIDESRPWRSKLERTIEQNYSKAPFYAEVMPVVSRLLAVEDEALARFNEAGIRMIAEWLGLAPKIVRSSELDATGKATDLLISLTLAAGGTTYLAGGGAAGYQEDEKFTPAGILLRSQGFEHPAYPQLSDNFEAGLSVIDALMNCGFAGTRQLLAT